MSSSKTEAGTLLSDTHILNLLGDYELHHSDIDNAPPVKDEPHHPNPVANIPADWLHDHRRIPAPRPINYHLDFEQRPAGANPAVARFVYVMLHGVWVNAVSFLFC